MRVLLDECLPRGLKRLLENHDCATVQEMGWSARKNGALLSLAGGMFDVYLTIDQGIEAQQNLQGRKIALLVLEARSNQIEDLIPLVPAMLDALFEIQAGELRRVLAPRR